jgi:hypothetical protein
MNLDRALVLLLASVGAVAGFTPSGRIAYSAVSSQSTLSNVRISVALSSEVEQAAESTETAEAAAPGFDTAIHVGNISFGEISLLLFMMSYTTTPLPLTC